MKILISVFCFSLFLMNHPLIAQDKTDDFFKAVQMGKIEQVEKFIEDGFDVNSQDKRGDISLIYAIWGNHYDIIELLISKGADVKYDSPKNGPALCVAASTGNQKICELLIKHGADINAKENNGWAALMFAAMHGESEIVKMLISAGADVNAKTKEGETALQRAEKIQKAKLGDTKEVIELLKKAGAK